MAERRENSVLISLRELRDIEEDRIKQEDEAERQARENAIRAREDAERRAREEVERQRREVEDAERRRVEEGHRQVREDQLRLDEAERRARVEAQAKLEQERLHLEMANAHTMASAKKPTGLYIAAGVLAFVVLGLGVFAYSTVQENNAAKAEAAMLAKNIESMNATMERNSQELNALLTQYQAAASEADRKRIQEEIDRKKAEQIAARDKLNDLRRQGTRKPSGGGEKKPDNSIKVKCDPNDPLCGL